MAALLENDTEVRARFERRAGEHDDHKNSGIDASLAGLIAKRLAHAGPLKVTAALLASHEKAGLRGSKYNTRYFARCVELAFKLPAWLTEVRELVEEDVAELRAALADAPEDARAVFRALLAERRMRVGPNP